VDLVGTEDVTIGVRANRGRVHEDPVGLITRCRLAERVQAPLGGKKKARQVRSIKNTRNGPQGLDGLIGGLHACAADTLCATPGAVQSLQLGFVVQLEQSDADVVGHDPLRVENLGNVIVVE
jgi:hypothetical protein